jgi:uncharacterized protein YhhL (DUF1145 family)
MPFAANADVRIAIVVVAVVLTFGLAARLREGSRDAPPGLTRWRVGLLLFGVVVMIAMLAPLAH